MTLAWVATVDRQVPTIHATAYRWRGPAGRPPGRPAGPVIDTMPARLRPSARHRRGDDADLAVNRHAAAGSGAAEVVDDEQVRGGELGEVVLAGLGERRLGEFFEEGVRFPVEDAVALVAPGRPAHPRTDRLPRSDPPTRYREESPCPGHRTRRDPAGLQEAVGGHAEFEGGGGGVFDDGGTVLPD